MPMDANHWKVRWTADVWTIFPVGTMDDLRGKPSDPQDPDMPVIFRRGTHTKLSVLRVEAAVLLKASPYRAI